MVDLKHNKKQSQAPLHWTLKSHKKWLYLHYHEAKLTVKKRNEWYKGNFTWTCVKYNLVLKVFTRYVATGTPMVSLHIMDRFNNAESSSQRLRELFQHIQ